MVQTGYSIPITQRLSAAVFWLWGLIYLFFATIFTDHKKLNTDNFDSNGRPKWGAGGKGGNMHGLNLQQQSRGGG